MLCHKVCVRHVYLTLLTCQASVFIDDDPSYIRVLDRLGLSIATVPQPQLQRSIVQTDTDNSDERNDGLPEFTHPRSQWLRNSLRDPEEDFKAIAKVGDISHGVSADDEYAGQTHAHAALARLCKTHVELDRNEAMREVRPLAVGVPAAGRDRYGYDSWSAVRLSSTSGTVEVENQVLSHRKHLVAAGRLPGRGLRGPEQPALSESAAAPRGAQRT